MMSGTRFKHRHIIDKTVSGTLRVHSLRSLPPGGVSTEVIGAISLFIPTFADTHSTVISTDPSSCGSIHRGLTHEGTVLVSRGI